MITFSPKLIEEICQKKKVSFSAEKYPSVNALILSINKELNANRKTEGLKLTIDGKTNLYSVLFTDIYYDANFIWIKW